MRHHRGYVNPMARVPVPSVVASAPTPAPTQQLAINVNLEHAGCKCCLPIRTECINSSRNLDFINTLIADQTTPPANATTTPAEVPVRMKFVRVGDMVVMSLDTITFVVNTIPNTTGVANMIFKTKVPQEFMPLLVGNPGDGQNFTSLLVDTAVDEFPGLVWIDTDGKITMTIPGPTETSNPFPPGDIVLYGGSVSWATA
jgi:hypothetical protein